MTRGRDFGVSSAVLADLTRQCGADYVLVGAYGGKLFDSDDEIDAQLAAVRRAPAATAVLGGGIGPGIAREQADRAGGDGLLLLLGSAAYRDGDVESAVRATVEALRD